MNVTQILEERQSQYGEFKDVADISQSLKAILYSRNNKFSDEQRESLEMICSKLARIVCGDPDYVDSWNDISGYATLIVSSLRKANV